MTNATEVEQKVAAEADKIRAEIKTDAETAIGTAKTDLVGAESKVVALWHKAAPYLLVAATILIVAAFLITRHKH